MQHAFAASAYDKQCNPAIYLLFCNLVNLIIILDAVSPIKAIAIRVVHPQQNDMHKYGRIVSGCCVHRNAKVDSTILKKYSRYMALEAGMLAKSAPLPAWLQDSNKNEAIKTGNNRERVWGYN